MAERSRGERREPQRRSDGPGDPQYSELRLLSTGRAGRFSRKKVESELREAVAQEIPDWRAVGLILDHLKSCLTLNSKEIGEIMKGRVRGALPLVHFICHRGGPIELLDKARAVGARVESPISLKFKKARETLDGVTPLHLAAALGRAQHIDWLLDNGHPADVMDGKSRFPQTLYIKHSANPDIAVLRKLVAAQPTPYLFDLVDACKPERLEEFGMLVDVYGAQPDRHKAKAFPIDRSDNEHLADYPEVLSRIADCARTIIRRSREISFKDFHSPPEMVVAEMLSVGVDTGDIYNSYLYGQALVNGSDPERLVDFSKDNIELNDLLPVLTFNLGPRAIELFARFIECTYDTYPDTHGWHPNIAEFFALLSHPQVSFTGSTDDLAVAHNPKTALLTGITRFNENQLEDQLSWEHARTWSWVGLLNADFVSWRFPCQRVHAADGSVARRSLVEAFGMTRSQDKPIKYSPHDTHLQTVYHAMPGQLKFQSYLYTSNNSARLDRFHENMFVGLGREFMVLSHPEYGTFIPANKSPVFGRDRLTHPAYWSPYGVLEDYTEEQLISIDRGMIVRDFRHLLDIKINGEDFFTQQLFLKALVEGALHLRMGMSQFIFDTQYYTAWNEGHLTGAWYSDGFPEFVDFLAARLDEYHRDPVKAGQAGHLVPDLAWIHPKYIPRSIEPFPTADGKEARRFTLDERRIDALRTLAETKAGQGELESTGVYQFLTHGLNNGLHLVMLAPRKKDAIMEVP